MSDSSFHPDQIAPVDFKIKRQEGKMIVTWKDGHVSQFEMMVLRKNCPCATCNAQRQEREKSKDLFPILTKDPGTGPPTIVNAQLVGNYAIQLFWSDDHDTGIFDFRFLRSLDQR